MSVYELEFDPRNLCTAALQRSKDLIRTQVKNSKLSITQTHQPQQETASEKLPKASELVNKALYFFLFNKDASLISPTQHDNLCEISSAAVTGHDLENKECQKFIKVKYTDVTKCEKVEFDHLNLLHNEKKHIVLRVLLMSSPLSSDPW